jgi:hypothetical protein
MSAAAAAAPPPFPGALKSARTGRWFKDPAAQDIHHDVWVEEECDQPPVEEFMRFVAAGPFKEAFAELQAAQPLKRQATSDLRQADAEAIGEAAGTVAAAAPGLAAEAEQLQRDLLEVAVSAAAAPGLCCLVLLLAVAGCCCRCCCCVWLEWLLCGLGLST